MLRIVSWNVCIAPLAEKFDSAALVNTPCNLELVELLENLNVFIPVSNLGFALAFGFGMLKQAVSWPKLSDINLKSVIVASAPLELPTNFILVFAFPKKVPWFWVARLNVSIFKRVVDVEYEAGIPAPGVYGFKPKVFVGLLNGPSLWFGAASLNTNFWDPIVPVTVSPIVKVPRVILTSRSFGVTNWVTSILSKKA